MKFPTDQQIGTAILWLENNEGDESRDCMAVAAWLEHERNERNIRSGARKAGVSIATFRKKLAEIASRSVEAMQLRLNANKL